MPSFLTRLSHWSIALAVVAVGGATALLAQSGTIDLPFTIQRLVIPPQRVARELEKAPQGTLLTMPVQEFDARLERVRQALQAREQKPRLVRSQYHAELIDLALVGEGDPRSEWEIIQPGANEAILPIESMNLALNKLQWEKDEEVLLGEFDANSLGLLVKPGTRKCSFDWSLRGIPTAEGLAFSLQVPPCPVTTFSLDLPADFWLSAPKSTAIVSGPLPDPRTPSKRLWQIQITGQGKLDLLLRRISNPTGAGPTVFAHVQSRQQLMPGQVQLAYNFDVDIVHGSVRELVLEGNAELQPYEVQLNSGEVQSWKWKKDKNDPGLLTIQFRQPVRGKISGLRVLALAPFPEAGLWTSPRLHLREAFSRGETLEVKLRPQLQMGQWDNGSFQLASFTTESDGTQSFTLADAASDVKTTRRPSLWLLSGGIDLHTRETNQWRLDSHGATLAADWDFFLLRGQLSQLAVKLPEKALGYQIDSVQLQPAELLRNWHTTNNILTVELKQPLTAHKKATLMLQLRAPFRESASAGRIVLYPQLEPLDSTRREGSISVIVDRIFQSQLLNSSVPLTHVSELAVDKKTDLPSYFFTFRDQRVTATLRLVPQAVQVQMRGKQTVVLSEQGATVQFHWEAEPLLGTPSYLDFRCSEGLLASAVIKKNDAGLQIHHWERLRLAEALPHLLHLGARHGLDTIVLNNALPTGALWRFHLTEPLKRKSSFTLEAPISMGMTLGEWQRTSLVLPNPGMWEWLAGNFASDMLPKAPGPKVWSLPLMLAAQGLNADQEITVESVREPIINVSAAGLRAASSVAVKAEKGPVHSLLFHVDGPSHGGPANLLVWTDPEKSSAGVNELCDQAKLSTLVHTDGRLSHRVQFRLWNWRDRTCVIGFSPGIEVVAVKIHDRWLDQLDVVDHPDGVKVTLPIDQNVPSVRCEIHARSAAALSWLPGIVKVVQPRVDWPIKPIDFRCRYGFAGSLLPLHQEAMTPIGIPAGTGNQRITSRWPRQIWSWGNSWLPQEEGADFLEKLENQKQMVTLAEAQLRLKTNKELALSEALEQLALQHLKEKVPLVIDQPALQALGLLPTTVVAKSAMSSQSPRPFWESLGLTYVALPSGALLTSPRRLERFALLTSADVHALDLAIQEALLHGRDSSTAFVPAFLWARTLPSSSFAIMGENEYGTDGEAIGTEITEWDRLPGSDTEMGFLAIDTSIGQRLGWIFSLLAGVLLWRIQATRSALTCLRVYLLLLLGSLVAAFWLPATLLELALFPLLFVEVAGFLWFLFTFVQNRGGDISQAGSTMMKPAVKAVLAIAVCTIPMLGLAQSPVPRTYTVLIVEGTKPLALVPIELKTRLDELENLPTTGPRNAVLLSAQYAGKFKDSAATFEATYKIYSAKDNASLVIPLAGVQLQEKVLLGKKAVFPTLHKNGYQITIPEKGIHELKLSFTARAVLTGDHLDLRFTVPRLLQNAISLEWATGVQSLQCVHGWGEEKSSTNTGPGVKEWHAQLGHENTVYLRWSAMTPTTVAKELEVQEMHFWDLRPASFSLSSSFVYAFGKGNLSQLDIAVPAGLQVRTVEAFPFPLTAVSAPLAIKQWQVQSKGLQGRLLIDFVQPVNNQIVVNLELVPQVSLLTKQIPAQTKGAKDAKDEQGGLAKKQLLLPLPAPSQGKSVLGYVGYRIDETESRSVAQNLAVQSILPQDFSELWKKNTKNEVVPSRAYSFQRKALSARLELILLPLDRSAQMDLSWEVDLHRADLTAKCLIVSAHDNLVMQEFFVPASLTLASVRGPEVARWNMRGNLLQVWLTRPGKQVELKITGWCLPESGKNRLVLPCLYPLHAQQAPGTLHIQTLPGLGLTTERLDQLHPLPGEPHHYGIERFPYEAIFQIQAKPAILTDAELLTKIQRIEHGVEVWCGIRLKTDRGRLPTLKLHLRDWPCENLLLDVPGATVQRLKQSTANDIVWSIKHETGLPQEVVVVLRGDITKTAPTAVTLPVLTLENVPFRARWVAWKDLEIVSADTKGKMTDTADREKLPFIHDFSSGVPAWKYASVKESFRGTAQLPRSLTRPTIRMLGSTEQVLWDDRQVWRCETDCWMETLEPTNLRIVFPVATESLSVFVDGQPRPLHAVSATEFLLSLSVASEPQHIRLRWMPMSRFHSFQNPTLDFPVLDPIPPSKRQRLLWIPGGLTLADSSWKQQPTLLPRLVHQAGLHVRLCSSSVHEPGKLLEKQAKFIADHQQQFYFAVQQSEALLLQMKPLHEHLDLASWQQRINHLKKDNQKWARERGYEEYRLAAEKSKSVSVPICSNGEEFEPNLPLILTDTTTDISLQIVGAQAFAQKRTRSELTLLIFVAFLVLSNFRHGLTLLQRLLPEMILCATLVGMWFLNGGLPGIAVVLSMLALRAGRLWRAWTLRREGKTIDELAATR